VVLRAAVFKRSRGELLFMASSLTGAKVEFFVSVCLISGNPFLLH
jgi:hypothetical protein